MEAMAGAYGSTSGTDERESRPVMERAMHFNLSDEVERLRTEEAWLTGDRASRTLAKEVDFRVLLSVLRDGAALEEVDGDARVGIQLLDGGAVVELDGDAIELAADEMAVVDAGQPWRLRAVGDCAVLLTLAWPREKARV
jgi:quercetin dioxygenase-like cupin family protein